MSEESMDGGLGPNFAELILGVGSPTAEDFLRLRDQFMKDLEACKPRLLDQSVWKCCTRERAGHLLQYGALPIQQAEICVWEPPIWEAALAGSRVFADAPVPPTFQIDRPQLWLLARSLRVMDLAVLGAWGFEEPMDVVGWLLLPVMEIAGMSTQEIATRPDLEQRPSGRRGLTAASIWMKPLPLELVDGDVVISAAKDTMFPYLRFFPPAISGVEAMGCYFEVGAAVAFLATEVARRESLPFSRPVRRRAQKEGRELPAVSVVVLRRLERPSPAEHSKDVEWQHQWIVRGHWRDQWRGPHKPRQPTYIEPYVKGPEDKPLKVPRESVAWVKR